MEDQKKKHPLNIENALKTRSEATAVSKEKFLKAYIKNRCNITKACKSAGISREAYYDWMNKDPEFKKKAEEAVESLFDNFEDVMFTKAIEEEDTTMLIWLSKTKMKNRGYVERREQDVSINPLEDVMKRAAQRKSNEDGND